ncbi:MAG: DUF1080 domain-containing protein [Bacteroidetes bacterium]|nr:DUF1080 domain-containing protein [Bacteroidota bacterium]
MKFFPSSYKSICLLSMVILAACEPPIDYERPKDTWVFRSVIDQKPRMLTVALHQDLYTSYDLQTGNLYKAWKGGVNYDGEPFIQRRSAIQPTSTGYPYIYDSAKRTQWSLKTSEGIEKPTINYLGHVMTKGQVGIEFELISKSGNSIKIRETPEYNLKESKMGLVRDFKILKGSSKDLTAVLTYKIAEGIVQRETINGKESAQRNGAGEIEISDNTTIITYFNPVPEGWAEPVANVNSILASGMKSEGESDCKTCHLEHENLVGPAYDSIAKRYPFDWLTINQLADKVISGGSGNWGSLLMTSHPDLSKQKAEEIVYYLLSLDGEPIPKKEQINLFLDINTIKADLDIRDRTNGDKKTKEPGVATNLYMIDERAILYDELAKSTSPILNGVSSVIHNTGNGDYGGPVSFYMEFDGYIKSDSETEKIFRLVSDDGSMLIVNNQKIINNDGNHRARAIDGKAVLKKGWNQFKVQFYQDDPFYDNYKGFAISLQWSDDGKNFSLVPDSVLYHDASFFRKLTPYIPKEVSYKTVPGDRIPLDAVHPSFEMFEAKPEEFHPRIGGIDFIDDEKMVICTWDSAGSVYIIKNYNSKNQDLIEVKQIASGLAEPLGIKMVDGEMYVLQKQELTKLIDTDGDEIIDEYRKVCNSWHVTSHYHEFAFGLLYKEGNFYATLGTDLEEKFKNVPDRGKVVRISKDGSEFEILAEGFRSPNGMSHGPDGALYVSDNQGNWIPTSKIVRIEKGKFYGFKHADWDRVKDYEEQPPLVWLPHIEISNSPSQQAILNLGPYKDQMIYGDVTHGGVKRIFIDEVDGIKQGAAFRFIQGLDAGINRLIWGPDGNLYAGGIGSGGTWRHKDHLWYSLNGFTYNRKSTFEMLAARAKSDGMEIELTEPIINGTNLTVEDFEVQQHHYVATKAYGGPKMDVQALKVASTNLSEDRRKIFVEIEGIEEGKVVYIRIRNPFISQERHSLWSTETWYTMTKRPVDQPGFKTSSTGLAHNTLSEAEVKEGWMLLFDGKKIDKWHTYNGGGINSQWVVTPAGELFLAEKGGGDIVTNQEFENYELTLEWKISKNGNSGLMFNIVEDQKYGTMWHTGPELQFLDDRRHQDAKLPSHRAGALYDMIATTPVTANEAEEWNWIRLILKDGHAEHWQNGYKVVEYEMFSPAWEEMIAKSKFKDKPDFGKARKGRLGLQDHGDKVWFRNIKIREL